MIKNFSFNKAKEFMKRGYAVRRKPWNENQTWIGLVPARMWSVFKTLPFIKEHGYYPTKPIYIIKLPTKQFEPWSPSKEDEEAFDWEIVKPPK